MKMDVAWPELSSHWKLLSFNAITPATWEVYLSDQREYWGEDRITGNRSHSWSWKGSEEAWLLEQERGYKNYLEHCSKWLGKFSVNGLIPVIRTERRGTIKLCIVKDDRTTWHDTVELWLFREIGLLPPNAKFRCEIYTFSTTEKSDGTPTSSFSGETPEVRFNIQRGEIVIGDALFQQIRA